MVWANDAVEIVISEYRERKYLHDRANSFYKPHLRKNGACEGMGQLLGCYTSLSQKETARTFSYDIELDCVAMETKSTVVRQTRLIKLARTCTHCVIIWSLSFVFLKVPPMRKLLKFNQGLRAVFEKITVVSYQGRREF